MSFIVRDITTTLLNIYRLIFSNYLSNYTMKGVESIFTGLFIVILAITGVSCNKDEPKDETEIIRIWVSSKTVDTNIGGADNLENPREYMQVKYSLTGVWEPMPFGTIEYFQYEKGIEYELSLLRTKLSNSSANESVYSYRLQRILSHKVLDIRMDGMDDYIEIPSEGKDLDIEFTTNSPCEIMKIEGKRFGEVNLIERNKGEYKFDYSLSLNITQNTGKTRMEILILRFGNGDEKKIEILQLSNYSN